MSIKVYLPDNREFNYEFDTDINFRRPELNKNFYICYNKVKEPCRACYKCFYSIVVEKTEDNKEIWVEYIERKRKQNERL